MSYRSILCHRGACKSVVLGWVAVCLLGCGPTGERNPVSGTVKFADGTPLETGRIIFEPVEGVYGFNADIGEGGKFEIDLEQAETAPGEYLVLVGASLPPDEKTASETGEILPSEPPVQLVAPRFSNPQETPLKATIQPGKNEFTFVVEPPASDE